MNVMLNVVTHISRYCNRELEYVVTILFIRQVAVGKNEGDPGSVKGTVVGSTAVLVVTSGRNGAIVMGKATRKGDAINWVTLEDIKSGEPEGDSPLILGEGTLKLDKSQSISQELINACKNQ
jgi:hypothetical protein